MAFLEAADQIAHGIVGPGACSPLVSSVATLKECAAEGTGLAVLPEANIQEEIKEGRLAIVPWIEGPLEVAILMAWHKERWVSPTLATFMDIARAHLLNRETASA